MKGGIFMPLSNIAMLTKILSVDQAVVSVAIFLQNEDYMEFPAKDINETRLESWDKLSYTS